MFKTRSITTALALAATTALAACGDPQPKTTVSGIPMGDYVMVGIGNGTVPLRNVTLQLRENSISGYGPCNSYGARNAAELPQLAVADFTTSERSCEFQALENQFFNALRQANEIEYYGGVLRVKGPTWLIFERGVPAAYAGTTSTVDAARAGQ